MGMSGCYLGLAGRLTLRWARFAGSLQLPTMLCSAPEIKYVMFSSGSVNLLEAISQQSNCALTT